MKLSNSKSTNILLTLLLLITGTVGIAIFVCYPRTHGLSGTYYGNMEWKGDPVFTVIDKKISTETLQEHQTQLPEAYSVEWTGHIDIPKTGIYTFFTASDDGSWLFVDGIVIVDNGGPHGWQEREGKIHLLKGLHSVKIRYFQIGGFAVLEPFWQQPGMASRSALTAATLFPQGTSTTKFWMYQTSLKLLSGLLVVWGIVILLLMISTHRRLHREKESQYAWKPPLSRTSLATLFAHLVRRLLFQPVVYAGKSLKHVQTWWWILVAVYTMVIFLTLSYARTISEILTDRYGDDVFSTITTVTLIVIGAVILSYFMISRNRLVSRLLVFAAIAGMYGYLLSPGFRDAIHDLHPFLDPIDDYLESLDIFPKYATEKIHFLEYGLLGLLLCKTLSYHIQNKMVYIQAVILVYMVGLMDEGIQWALPQRVGEYRDIWLNILSGTLAVLLVALAIRPRVFPKAFQWFSLRPIFYTFAASLLLTGLFLQSAHRFGTSIFMPDSGIQFVSAFTEYQLLTLDKVERERMEGKLAEDIPPLDHRVFDYEARRHQYLRDLYHREEQFFESYCEQEILKTYFRWHMQKRSVALFEYDLTQFTFIPDPDATVFHESEGQELAISQFSARTMWMTIAIAGSLLCFLATLIPGSTRAMPQYMPQLRPRKPFERIGLRVLFGLALLFACFFPIVRNSIWKSPEHTNLIILTLESSQPDYLSAYGYPKNTTPFFDELAEHGVLFSNMITSTAWTIPSLASMLTGVNPNVHGIDARGKLMDPQISTLFEILERRGYVIGDTSYTLTEPSINSVYKKSEISPEVALSEGRSEESYLLSWMEANKERPFFGWVHFHTTHLPYRANPPYDKLFLEDIDQKILHDVQIKAVLSQIIVRKGEVDFDPERHGDVVRTLFIQTLRQQDAKVGKVLMKLDELGLRDNTLVVVTADHGDELLEHGFVGHASTNWDTTVFDDLINVPLVIYYPKKLPKGKRLDTQVRMIDLMPTVLDILDIPLEEEIQGKSFFPLIQGKGDFQETAFSETSPCGYSCPQRLANNRLRSIRTNEWKLISIYTDATKETRYELYNLREDPGETQNVIEEHPDIAVQFKAELQQWMEAPAQFAYATKKSEQPHYLDMDVENRPIVLFPKTGTVMTPDTDKKQVHLKWIGDEQTDYLIEYDIGKGGYHMTGELEVVGNEQWFGPFPEDIWQALPLYNPWKFRIIPKNYRQYPSEWITFEMKYE